MCREVSIQHCTSHLFMQLHTICQIPGISQIHAHLDCDKHMYAVSNSLLFQFILAPLSSGSSKLLLSGFYTAKIDLFVIGVAPV